MYVVLAHIKNSQIFREGSTGMEQFNRTLFCTAFLYLDSYVFNVMFG